MRFAYGAITLCGRTFQNPSATQQLCNSVERLATLLSGPTTPHRQRRQALTPARFRLFPFRSPLLRESLLLSFPQGTEMFQFPWFPLPALCVQTGVHAMYACGGFPHSDIHGSKLGRQLPVAYRSHPRPSSASGAKASTVGFCSLENKMLVLAMQFSRSGQAPPRLEAACPRRESASGRRARPKLPPGASAGLTNCGAQRTEQRSPGVPPAPATRAKPARRNAFG